MASSKSETSSTRLEQPGSVQQTCLHAFTGLSHGNSCWYINLQTWQCCMTLVCSRIVSVVTDSCVCQQVKLKFTSPKRYTLYMRCMCSCRFVHPVSAVASKRRPVPPDQGVPSCVTLKRAGLPRRSRQLSRCIALTIFSSQNIQVVQRHPPLQISRKLRQTAAHTYQNGITWNCDKQA